MRYGMQHYARRRPPPPFSFTREGYSKFNTHALVLERSMLPLDKLVVVLRSITAGQKGQIEMSSSLWSSCKHYK